MDANVTPGPWRVDGSIYENFAAEVVGKRGIAQVWDGENAVADARLMAAAPDLLEALRGAIGALEFSRDYHRDLGNEEQAFTQDKLDAAVNAIAKATGA